jgi:hypothetical protein
MTSPTDTPVKKKGGIPWYAFFAGGGHLYYTCRCPVRRIDFVDSGMDFCYQCAGGILLCLGCLESR